MTESASANKIRLWSDSAAGNNSSDINGSGINWVEEQNPSTVNNSAREVLAQVRQWYYPDQAGWADWGATASIASQTVFKLAGDQTGMATAGRRLRLRGGSVAARYASILSASYTAETTITIVDADGSLSASMSVVGLATTSAQTAPRRIDKLDVSGTLSVGALNVATIAVSVANVGSLSVSGGVKINGALDAAGAAFSGNVGIVGDFTVGGDAAFITALRAKDTFTASGNARFLTNIDVSATASVGQLNVGSINISGVIMASTSALAISASAAMTISSRDLIAISASGNFTIASPNIGLLGGSDVTIDATTITIGSASAGKTVVIRAESVYVSATSNPGFDVSGGLRVSATATVGFMNVGSVITIASGPTIRSGTGAPESAVTASKGSLFMRTDGAAGSTLYYKSTGTGNTGWTAVA